MSGSVSIIEAICSSLEQRQPLAPYRGQIRRLADSAWAPVFQEPQPADNQFTTTGQVQSEILQGSLVRRLFLTYRCLYVFTMDGDLKHSPSETRQYTAAEDTPYELPPGGSTENTAKPKALRARVYNPRRWFVRLSCIVGAASVGYLFSYLVSNTDNELRWFLFFVVSIGIAIAACGLAAQVERSRDM